MNVKINGSTYTDVEWIGDTLRMETDQPLSQLESAFIPDSEANITVYDGEQEVAKYYNKGLDSMMVSGSDPRTVSVRFRITQIEANAEDEIRENMEISDEALVDLAASLSDLYDLDLDALAQHAQSVQETIDTWFSNVTAVNTFIQQCTEKGGIFDRFDARITALEHEVGIVSVEMNETPAEGEGEQNG